MLAVWLGASLLAGTSSSTPSIATGVAGLALDPDPAGVRVLVVLADRRGRDATTSGELTVELREPGGASWRSTRVLSPGDFRPLKGGSLLAGRVGYSVLVPTSAWSRPPRSGGLATISVVVRGKDGPPFSGAAQDLFP